MTELLPCPFCGSPAAFCCLEDEPGSPASFWVNCSCGVETPERRTEDEAVALWNRRTAAAATPGPDQIAGVYCGLDAEQSRAVDRQWAKQRGYILPTDGTCTATPPEPAATPPQERAYQAARDNLREAWAALAMIRETVEMLAPSGSVKASEHLDGPTFMHEADALVSGIMALASGFGGETIQTLLDLLNPLHGELDRQTYDAKVAMDFDMPSDYAHDVMVTAQQERDLTQAVLILEDRKLALSPHLRPMQSGGE